MLDTIFNSIFASSGDTVISVSNFLICIAVSLVIGAFLAWSCTYKSKTSKSFKLTIGLLPAVVCVVIMMVNGNVGAGVAVAGAFSLVRFRSAPGSAKDIAIIFLTMGAGLISGMGYLAYSVLYAVIMGIVMLICGKLLNKEGASRVLSITIPEDLNYDEIFNEVFEEYTSAHEMLSVKTTNMGSLYKLKYKIAMKDFSKEKQMIDDLRLRNGNLEIAISQEVSENEF